MKSNFRVLLIHANTMMENLIPVGVGLLAGALKEKGIDYEVFDTTYYKTLDFYPDEARVKNLQLKEFNYEKSGIKLKPCGALINDFAHLVESYKPSLIALSVVEPTYSLGLELLRSVKDKGIPTIIGGVPATFAALEMLNEDSIDMVCIGEGEISLPILCESIINGESPYGTPGVWFKLKDGRIVKNGYKCLADINKGPFLDVTKFAAERFIKPIYGCEYRMIALEISRGCPYGCSYCASPSLARQFGKTGRWYREKTPERIAREIEFYVKNYSANFLYIVSDTFLGMNKKRLDPIMSILEECKLPFWVNTRPETITEENIEALERTKCVRMSVGIEHGNEEFRKKVLNRRYSNKLCIDKFDIMGKSKIPVTINNITGFPEETRSLFFDTVRLTKKCLKKANDTASLFIFAPYRGTSLRELCVQKGYLPKDYWSDFDTNVARDFKMPHLSNEEISGFMRTFGPYCKFPESDWPLIAKAEIFDGEGERTFKEISDVFWSLKRGDPITPVLEKNGIHKS